MNLLTVLPRITGVWQVSGRSDVSYEERVRLDMYYIRNWSTRAARQPPRAGAGCTAPASPDLPCKVQARSRGHLRARGFSLLELVVVIVVIATVAAIAVPRMSRAAAGARESACRAGLRTYLQALELYQGEHGTYPSGITPSILSTRELIPNPFGGSLTNPILRDSSGDASLQHPMTKRFRADNPEAKTWWYNPANGAFRALVPQTGIERAIRRKGQDELTTWAEMFDESTDDFEPIRPEEHH